MEIAHLHTRCCDSDEALHQQRLHFLKHLSVCGTSGQGCLQQPVNSPQIAGLVKQKNLQSVYAVECWLKTSTTSDDANAHRQWHQAHPLQAQTRRLFAREEGPPLSRNCTGASALLSLSNCRKKHPALERRVHTSAGWCNSLFSLKVASPSSRLVAQAPPPMPCGRDSIGSTFVKFRQRHLFSRGKIKQQIFELVLVRGALFRGCRDSRSTRSCIPAQRIELFQVFEAQPRSLFLLARLRLRFLRNGSHRLARIGHACHTPMVYF